MVTKLNTTINGKNYYRIRRTINGVQKTFYGKSKLDAEKKYRAYVERDLQDASVSVCASLSPTFSALASDYITEVLNRSQKYATGTIANYERAYRRHIKGSHLDTMSIADVKPLDVQKFYNSLDVSKSVMQSVQKFMKGFCRWLQLNGYCGNFLDAVEIPKKPENKRHEGIVVWSDEDIRTIADASVRACGRFRAFFLPLVLIYTGARISEALSLRYSDFHDGMVSIERQHYLGEIKPPKYNSVRSLPIHPELQKAFEMHKAWHEREMKKNKYKTDYIFTTSTGVLYDNHNIRRALERFYNRIGVEPKHPHAYRATFCTALCKSGVPIQVASKLMGHKNISVTAKFYTGIDRSVQESAINSLNFSIG